MMFVAPAGRSHRVCIGARVPFLVCESPTTKQRRLIATGKGVSGEAQRIKHAALPRVWRQRTSTTSDRARMSAPC